MDGGERLTISLLGMGLLALILGLHIGVCVVFFQYSVGQLCPVSIVRHGYACFDGLAYAGVLVLTCTPTLQVRTSLLSAIDVDMLISKSLSEDLAGGALISGVNCAGHISIMKAASVHSSSPFFKHSSAAFMRKP